MVRDAVGSEGRHVYASRAASELLKPFDARLMRCYAVSTRINRVANDDEECSAPVELPQIQVGLFLERTVGLRELFLLPTS